MNDITSLDVSTPRDLQEVTGIDKSAKERIPLLADLSVALKGVFNPAASKSHVTLKGVGSAAAQALVLTIAAKTLSANVLFTDYKLARKENGTFDWDAPALLADGNVPAWT
jgi:hypothetical protein